MSLFDHNVGYKRGIEETEAKYEPLVEAVKYVLGEPHNETGHEILREAFGALSDGGGENGN